MSYHRVLPPLPIAPLNGHNPDVASQEFSFLRPSVMTNQATIQASKSNATKQSSLISENLGLKRETTSPSTESLEDEEESPKRARSSSPTFVSKENSQQVRGRPSMRSESKEGPTLLQGESPTSEVCLCQPDPKVPRPRNAFILYRQHHQSAVVEQNPGLSNPDISKVIGEHWKSSSLEVQTHWRNLAEQEKLRHQRQYPDYRYQPRRGGRSHSISAGSPNDRENLKCQKCGGYSIPKSSGIMSTPGLTSPSTDLVSPADRHPSTSTTNSIAYRSLHDPSPASATANFTRSRASAGSYSTELAALQLASPRLNKRPEPDSPRSPPQEDSKRFRVVNGLGIQGLRGAPDTPYPFLRKPIKAESGAHHPRSESVHHPQHQHHPTSKPGSGTFTMGPPPRPQQHHFGGNKNSTLTSSSGPLTLNPLHSDSPTTLDSPASAQAKSLEAMVMSIPALNKIRLITQISPPLPPSSPSSPPLLRTRGFVIAIDGPEPGPVAQLTETVFNVLSESHPVKIFRGPEPFHVSGIIGSSNDKKLTLEKGEGKYDFQGYFETISAYHRISAEVVAFITSSIPRTTPDSGNPLSVTPTKSAANTSSASTPPISPKAVPTPNQQQEPNNISSTNKHHPHEPFSLAPSSSPSQPTTTSPSPIALLPHFQLSHTDFSSSRIPITDNYAPVDHWQWMATLWRGIVGPDITIALLPPPPSVPVMQTPISGPNAGSAGGMMCAAGVSNRDLASGKVKGGVEVRLDETPRVMLVRGGEGKGACVGEGVLRRVGFELGEWVRGKEEERGV